VLTAGEVDTPYTRQGRGETLLLLRDNDGRDADNPLAGTLAAEYRVIAPLAPPGFETWVPHRSTDWLRNLLDGLGVERACIVAEARMAPSALSFAASDPLRVQRLALLTDNGAEGTASKPDVRAFTNPTGLSEFLAGSD
jgi:hypothetical protein